MPVTDYGGSAITDPDAVLFDPTGSISGTAGAVLVGGIHASPKGRISAILPDESVVLVFGPTFDYENPQDMAFDSTGRLIFIDPNNSSTPQVLVSTGGPPTTLFTVPSRPLSLAIDAADRIFTTVNNGCFYTKVRKP